jgi:hypothetical protein
MFKGNEIPTRAISLPFIFFLFVTRRTIIAKKKNGSTRDEATISYFHRNMSKRLYSLYSQFGILGLIKSIRAVISKIM